MGKSTAELAMGLSSRRLSHGVAWLCADFVEVAATVAVCNFE
jgi:hypothetical protein